MIQSFYYQNDDDIDESILNERNNSFIELNRDIEELAEAHQIIAQMINQQGENIDSASENIEMSEININEGTNNIIKAHEYVRKSAIMVRDVAIIAGGSLLGAGGFILGPIVGIGTMIGGGAAGASIVAGLHQFNK